MPSSKSAGRTTIVCVSHEAFLAMCFATADAALIAPDFNKTSYALLAKWEKERGTTPIRKAPTPPPTLLFSETGHEIGGVAFGTAKHTRNQTVISVEWATTTISLCSDDSVQQSGASALLLTDLAEAARASFGLPLCSWHSHPQLSVSPREVASQQLYAPSEIDIEGPTYPNCLVALVITIAWPDKSKSRPADQSNLAVRRIGDFEFILTGHLPGRRWDQNDPALEIRVGY